MNTNTETTTTNETELVESWNKNHDIGDQIEIQDEKGHKHKAIIRTKAFIGRGNIAKVVLMNPRGLFSVRKILNKKVFVNPPTKEKEKRAKKVQKEPTNHKRHYTKQKAGFNGVVIADQRRNFYKLKDHLLKMIKENNQAEITKITINLMFPPIHSMWGIIKSTEQFEVFIQKYGMKIDQEVDSKYIIKAK